MVNFENEDLKAILNKNTRHFLPGYGRLSFMIYLKSLIDPSFFRVEEQLIKGRVMKYARMMENDLPDLHNTDLSKIHDYYNAIDDIFKCVEGESPYDMIIPWPTGIEIKSYIATRSLRIRN